MTDEQRTARIAELEKKMAKRRGVPGFSHNAAFIEAEIVRLKAEEATSGN